MRQASERVGLAGYDDKLVRLRRGVTAPTAALRCPVDSR